MLYPDFNELVALKDRRTKSIHRSCRSVRAVSTGNHHSPFRGQGLDFDSVREYVPGDDIRNIDWRVTARTGLPHLKIFREDRERHIMICVDMNATMRFGTKNTFKSVQAARAAAFLGWQGLAQQDCVGACLFGDVSELQFFPPKKTRKPFCEMLKVLSSPVKQSSSVSLNTALKQIENISQTGSLIYLISDFLDLDSINEPLLKKLNSRCDLVFIAINDRADKSISSAGAIQFSAKGERLSIDTDNIFGRKAYLDLWNENRKQLFQICGKCKIPLIELTTESDIRRDLVLELKTINKRKR